MTEIWLVSKKHFCGGKKFTLTYTNAAFKAKICIAISLKWIRKILSFVYDFLLFALLGFFMMQKYDVNIGCFLNKDFGA